MKEINIAKMLVNKRREKGITQDDVASYIGVSKASVSKWETEQSYPDITFLPQLATYFNISIDELIGYAPQLTKDDIRKMYIKFAEKFATEPFDEVLNQCHEITKKYYSCFPLLTQIAVLLLNHLNLAPKDKYEEVIREILNLCDRIQAESDDLYISNEAIDIKVACYLMNNQPQQILDTLGEDIRPISNSIDLISQAYIMLGNNEKANEVTQIAAYQHLISFVGSATQFMMLSSNNMEKVEEILHRAIGVADLYNMNKLHPNVMMQIYLAAAQLYSANGNNDKALDMLDNFTNIGINSFPYVLHGDSFFDKLDNWFETFDLGTSAPRNEKLIKESLIQGAEIGFEALADIPRYQAIMANLKSALK